MKVFAVASLLLPVIFTSANAACSTTNFRFHFSGENVSTNQETDAKGCGIGYKAGGTTTFSEASIAQMPSHGTLRQRSSFDFGYLPKSGYKGPDSYAIKICGASNANKGCSTITYNVTVN